MIYDSLKDQVKAAQEDVRQHAHERRASIKRTQNELYLLQRAHDSLRDAQAFLIAAKDDYLLQPEEDEYRG